MARWTDRQVIEAGVPLQFEQVAPSAVEGERSYVVVKFLLRDCTGKPYAVCGIATDLTESKRAQQLQAAVLKQMALGKSNKEIGQVLYISEHTVKNHVTAILEKLNAVGRTEAVALAAQRGLVNIE